LDRKPLTDSDPYRTIAAATQVEIDKVSGSRFLADAAPITTAAEAQAVIARARSDNADATHHCWAYRLAPPKPDFRWSDDGEPINTAGKPILQRIDGVSLANVVVVVTRWFGGTKLGTGGLIRAYGDAARAALEAADVVVAVPLMAVRMSFEYGLSGPVQGVLNAFALSPTGADYGADVTLDVACPLARIDALVRSLGEVTAGRARVIVDPD